MSQLDSTSTAPPRHALLKLRVVPQADELLRVEHRGVAARRDITNGQVTRLQGKGGDSKEKGRVRKNNQTKPDCNENEVLVAMGRFCYFCRLRNTALVVYQKPPYRGVALQVEFERQILKPVFSLDRF
jgi:hypothetical protein